MKTGKRRTDKEFKEEVFNAEGNDYEFLEEFKTVKEKILCRHNVCHHEYKVRPHAFLQGQRCPRCSIESARKKNTHTADKFLNRVRELTGTEYTVVGKYVNTNTLVRVRHNKCGEEYKVRPDAFVRGTRCRRCLNKSISAKNTKTTETFSEEVQVLGDKEYTLHGVYVDVHTRVSLTHKKCGHRYSVLPYLFMRGRRCPKCNQSQGERLTNKVLEEMGVDFTAQKTFSELVNIRKLSYDFFIEGNSTLIEYQGVQHYEPVELFGGISTYKKQQENDRLKRDYASRQGYSLIEVPYTEDTFDKIKEYIASRMM